MAQAQLDALGWTYISLALTWTAALIGGMTFLHHHRNLPCLQIRRLPLVFAGISSLHAYGAICLTAYTFIPLLPCSSEFWIMSIYLPFGIAMFHAANSQFLHIASRQKQFARMSALSDTKTVNEKEAERLAHSRFRRIIRGVERVDKVDRMMVWIAIGLGIQLALTIFVFFGSKKFHPSYGIFDYTVKGTETEARMRCSKGWEWWLSIVWQFFWAWIYAPYMLWKSRGIRDVHGWRTQTILCCLAGLPASPLWLAGLYVPQMASVNRYFVPPMWFSVSIFLIEVFTIGLPIIQVLKTQTLRQETIEALAEWERRQGTNGSSNISTVADFESHSGKSSTFTGTIYALEPPMTPIKSLMEAPSTVMFNMAALETTLRTNPDPLLRFAALKDFSGENVSFLTHIADWRRAWFIPQRSSQEHRHERFVAAVRIYASFVSLDFAEFPINISAREMGRLHEVFSNAAAVLMHRPSSRTNNTITPFDADGTDASSTVDFKTGINLATLGRANLKSVSRMTELGREEAVADIEIPEAFSAEIFASAEREIKYLVFTNTWPKFVIATFEMSEEERHEMVRKQHHGWKSVLLCTA